jgi:alanine racemase
MGSYVIGNTDFLGEPMEYAAWAEINIKALKANVKRTRSIVGRDVKILLTVKADAYGHGARYVAKAAVSAGVDMLGVATLHEGIELRNAGAQAPILILSPSLPCEIAEILEWQLTPTVSDMAFAKAVAAMARESDKAANVHVEIDTGMTRAGVNQADAQAFLKELSATEGISLEGIYTHFPTTYDEDGEFVEDQIRTFGGIVSGLKASGIEVPMVHTANSAAITQAPESHFNMVRPGGMIYGMFPRPGLNGKGLEPVMTFKSRVVNVKDVRGGKTVSYGRTYRFERDSRVAAVAAGYGHGLSRALSNKGHLLVRGRRAPIVGNVTMDVTLVDVSSVPKVEIGDEVVIFGKQGSNEISVYEVAEQCGTISYEITCGIGKRVPRVYIEDGRVTGVVTLIGERLPKEGVSL